VSRSPDRLVAHAGPVASGGSATGRWLLDDDGPVGVERDRVAVVLERHGLAALVVRPADRLQNPWRDRVVQRREVGRVDPSRPATASTTADAGDSGSATVGLSP
jgi:hypothetical protein